MNSRIAWIGTVLIALASFLFVAYTFPSGIGWGLFGFVFCVGVTLGFFYWARRNM